MKISKKARPIQRWTSKAFIGTVGALLASCTIAVICLIAFGGHRLKTFASKGPPGIPGLSTKVTISAGKGVGTGTPLPESTQAQSGTIAAEHPASSQRPTPVPNPTSTPAAVSQPESNAFASDSEFLDREEAEAGPKSEERQLPKPVRKNLEKERREAERKRARLEDMYQKHLITSEAYKKGEKEYKNEIAKYRSELNGGLPNSFE